jgi:hypothetical protein
MSRRIALAGLLALWPALASAQQALIAPTAPTADSSDRIATTQWVNNVLTLGLPLPSGKIFIGSAGNIATPQTMSADATLSILGAMTLATVNANVGSFGSATQCPTLTVNGKGLITAASAATCTPAIGSVTGLGTGVATALGLALNGSGGVLGPTPTRAGDIPYWNGSAWTTLAGNNSGTNCIQENASGVPSFASCGGGGSGITIGTTTITSGTTTKVLFDNAGVVGEYTISGSGNVAMTTSPVFTTPNLGTPSAATLTSATGLPISTGLTGAGTGVLTALGVNVGSAGAPVLFNGALGTPSSGTATNLSGTAASLTSGNATNTAITDDTTTNATMLPTWVTANTGNLPQKVTSTKLTFNPSTGVLSSTSFTGAGTGLTGTAASLTAGTATNAVNSGITNDTTTNATMFPVWVTANTGNLPIKVTSTKLSFNPSTGALTSTSFSGSGASLTSLNGSNVSSGTVPVANGGTGVTTLAADQARLQIATLLTVPVTVDFSVAGDTTVPVVLPTGFTQFRPTGYIIDQCSASITAATFGVFTATAAGGLNILTNGTAGTVTNNTANTSNNIQFATAVAPNTIATTGTGGNIFFRVGSTASATCSFYMQYNPLP